MKVARIRIGPVAEAIIGIVAIGGVVAIAVCAPNALQVLAPFFKKKKYSAKKAIERNIEILVQKGLLTKKRNQLELTQKGRLISFLKGYDNVISEQKKWDGKWRLVIFDVPHSKNKERLELTRGMKMHGFHLLQRSVWLYPYPCDAFIQTLTAYLDLKQEIIYITEASLPDEGKYKKIFKL
jgi:DNA-binding transcriptional regulator PaaX